MGKKVFTVKDIMKRYGLKRSYVYQVLNIRGCPLISGGPASNFQSKKYLVNAERFDEWFMGGMNYSIKIKNKKNRRF